MELTPFKLKSDNLNYRIKGVPRSSAADCQFSFDSLKTYTFIIIISIIQYIV